MKNYAILIILIIINIPFFAFMSLGHFPTADEARLVPDGLGAWRSWPARAAVDVPPLAPMVAALPVLVRPMPETVTILRQEPKSESGSGTGARVSLAEFRLARLAGLLWWATGAWLVFRWAGEIHGGRTGWLALVLWSFGPNILAREQTATSDLPAAVACFAATYVFWHWLRRPSWGRAAAAGGLLGMALLTEFAALALGLAWPLAAVAFHAASGDSCHRAGARAGQVALGLTLALVVLNAGYGFAGVGRPLGDLRFASRALGGVRPAKGAGDEVVGGNRFHGTWAGRIPVPLPADYLTGIDRRQRDAEVRPLGPGVQVGPSLSDRGGFSLATLLAKVPLGTWGLVLVAVAVTLLRPTGRSQLADAAVVWVPAATFLALAPSPAGFLISMPALLVLPAPFAIVGIGGLERFLRPMQKAGWLVAALMAWSVASGLASLPHPLFYLNEAVGRRRDLAVRTRHALPGDAGQGLLSLRIWLVDHPEAAPVGLACRYPINPEELGIDWAATPVVSGRDADDSEYTPRGGPFPGYYAIDLFELKREKYRYFLDFRPAFMAGDSLPVYHLTPEDADRVRRRAGLATDRDLLALKKWLERHPEASRIGLACRTVTDPRTLKINATVIPIDPGPERARAPWYTPRIGPYPGYFALDLYNLSLEKYSYFSNFTPIAHAGDSILIYHVAPEDAERVRRRVGYPSLGKRAGLGGRTKGRGFLQRTHRGPDGTVYNYTVFVPYDYRGDRPYPLILFLHGSGERGRKGQKYLNVTFPPAIRKQEDTFGFIVVIPQGHSGHWDPEGVDAQAALEILARVEEEYKVDPQRVSLVGVSSGGEGVWALAAAHPDLWTAIVPVASASADPNQAPRIAHLPCWCFHNARDVNHPPAISRVMVAALRAAGGSPRYTEFLRLTSDDPKARLPRHNAWDKAYSMPELYDWLIAQSREQPNPPKAQ